ncbi:hypothetical protein C8F04DRAFT_1189936 [Mycena alexandri]|uniref:Uncharacterized protein n=1 Tax=Mycena alexandri TaxID=1745969 RepID=A0AAD6WWD3_9AGAR|nr:hypothetical protein C8F04DRAFT_1189936 [Mycena alexandri]
MPQISHLLARVQFPLIVVGNLYYTQELPLLEDERTGDLLGGEAEEDERMGELLGGEVGEGELAGELAGGVGRQGNWARPQRPRVATGVNGGAGPGAAMSAGAKTVAHDQIVPLLLSVLQSSLRRGVSDGIVVTVLHVVCVVALEIGADTGLELRSKRLGLEGNTAVRAHLAGASVVCQSRQVMIDPLRHALRGTLRRNLKLLVSEELRDLAYDRPLTNISPVVGVIPWTIYADHGKVKLFFVFFFQHKLTSMREKKKKMFKPYDAAAVPDSMPFPDLALVATIKGEETPVPKLNKHQRSWILDVALRGVDLQDLQTRVACAEFYDTVKSDVFDAKAFQHVVQPQDAAVEASLPALVATWKLQTRRRPREQQTNLPRPTMTPATWRKMRAIQKVISNKRTADRNRKPTTNVRDGSIPIAPATALAKLMGLVAYTGRDKFRNKRHDKINEYSATLSGTNAAEAILWAKEDQALWESSAEASEENIDWEEQQWLILGGFQHLVDTLNTGRKFRPFVANISMAWLDENNKAQLEWIEALPIGVKVEKPLQDYAAARDDSGEPTMPVFPYSAEDLDDMSPNSVAQLITTFLMKLYGRPVVYVGLGIGHGHGRRDATPGFFRKLPAVVGEEEEEGATAEAAWVKQQQQMEEAVRVKEAETEAVQVKEAEAEAVRVKEAEDELARVKEAEAEAARVKQQQMEEAVAWAKEAEEAAKEAEAAQVKEAKGRKGRKRKAEDELVPEPEQERWRPVRNCQTPQEAERECNQKAAEEAARRKVKPSAHSISALKMSIRIQRKPVVGKLGSPGRDLSSLANLSSLKNFSSFNNLSSSWPGFKPEARQARPNEAEAQPGPTAGLSGPRAAGLGFKFSGPSPGLRPGPKIQGLKFLGLKPQSLRAIQKMLLGLDSELAPGGKTWKPNSESLKKEMTGNGAVFVSFPLCGSGSGQSPGFGLGLGLNRLGLGLRKSQAQAHISKMTKVLRLAGLFLLSQGRKCTNFFGLVTGHREDVRMFRKSHKFGGNGSKNRIFARAQARLIGEAAAFSQTGICEVIGLFASAFWIPTVARNKFSMDCGWKVQVYIL